ncbi:hypothetical protein MMU07_11140 [Aquiflexum sp. LQ15W]|nr:hypothetical protein [Cognataquiflexum nitidum]MCH6200140.1 hypothetical protein [Cognataquiflexum nitidum]
MNLIIINEMGDKRFETGDVRLGQGNKKQETRFETGDMRREIRAGQ